MNNESPIEAVNLHWGYLQTPIGLLELSACDAGIRSVMFSDNQTRMESEHSHLIAARQQLKEYFEGSRIQFDLPFAAKGTAFQQSVWQALTQIEFGETTSYMDIAKRINNPKSVRAVGAANGKNPLSIIVPCHRVIGKNGTLTGYAGGLHRKSWLLEFENRQLPLS